MGTVPPPAAGSPGMACQNRRPFPSLPAAKILERAVGSNRWLSPFARRLPPESSHEGTPGAMSSLLGRPPGPGSRPHAVAGAGVQRTSSGAPSVRTGRSLEDNLRCTKESFQTFFNIQLTNDERDSLSTILTSVSPRSVADRFPQIKRTVACGYSSGFRRHRSSSEGTTPRRTRMAAGCPPRARCRWSCPR